MEMLEKVIEDNPWDVTSRDDFLFYCCPRNGCETKCKNYDDFYQHAVETHFEAKYCLDQLKDPLELPQDESLDILDTIDERRSPGEMLEDQGRAVHEHARILAEDQKKLARGTTERLVPGGYIVYTVADKEKTVH